jgi:hypothetical protein
MTDVGFTVLDERGVVALQGPDTRRFLQDLITNDVERVQPDQGVYAALLTPQGKYLFDFFVLQDGDRLLLETERARLGDLVKRLLLYRLRAKVEIEDVSEHLAVAALVGDDIASKLDLADRPGACRPLDQGFVMIDPRLSALGARALLPPNRLRDGLEQLGFMPTKPAAYDQRRIRLGVPDGSRDLVVEKSTLLENGFEELHGIDFQKGCFVGQELTARMKYRGLVRKRLMPVSFSRPPPEPGTIVRCGSREAGEMRSCADGHGLALLRLERIAEAKEAATPLLADGTAVVPDKPDWVNF